ncbi:MAG: CRISPR-associated protein Cas5 family, partial [uncultured bacterium]
RASTVLRDVGYVIEAHYDMTDGVGAEEHPGKHISIFNRRAEAGQCFHQPCMGTREFPAAFALLPEGAALPAPSLTDSERNRDFGWMLHDIDFAGDKSPRFFRAEMKNGMIEVPSWQSGEVKA